MTDEITFFVPGRPFSKKRPRFGKGRTYTDPETEAAESAVRWYAKRAFGSQEPWVGPVCLECRFVFKRAKRTKSVGWRHIYKPDLDNLEKLVMDALNPHAEWHGAWLDDSQVAGKHAAKNWASDEDFEGTTVTVSRLPD